MSPNPLLRSVALLTSLAVVSVTLCPPPVLAASSPATLADGRGYQLYCTNPNGLTVQITGKLPTRQASTNLLPGWHLLPAVTLESKPVSWLTQGLDTGDVRTFDTATQTLTPATTVEAGLAYFVNIRTASLFAPSLPRDPTTRFVYDGDGGRVKQITAAGTTTFLGQSYEIAPDGTTTTYVFAGSQRIAALTTGPTGSTGATGSTGLRFYHPDHLGSSNVVTDATGAVVELAEYTPYGSLSRREGPANVPQKFTGQRLDASTGLYFYHARYYDPTLGRFVSPDPFVQDPSDPQTLNRYSYVRNNPVNFVDPSGYGWLRKLLAVVVAVVATIIMPEGAGIWWALAAASMAAAGAVAGDQIGAAIERSQSDGNAYAAPTPPSPGTPFTPSVLHPGPVGDSLPDSPRIIVGDPVPQPNREVPGDWIPEAPRGGPTVDNIPLQNVGQMYNALHASETPKPTDDVGPKPEEGAKQGDQEGQTDSPEKGHKRRQTGVKIPGSEVEHREHEHGPYKKGHRHWVEWHTNPKDPSKNRKVKRTGPL